MSSTGTVLTFFRPRHSAERDWTQEELAQFYRVEAALIRSGLLLVSDRGLSDEGDPWFIFCRQDNGEVIAHFARIGDQYVIASSAFPGVARGRNFALLISDLMRSSPLPIPREIQQSQNVYLHPAAMLVALLATAFLVSSENDGQDHHASHFLAKDVLRLISLGEVAVLSAVAIATTWLEYQIDSGLKILEAEHTSEPKGNAAEHSHVVSEISKVLQNFIKIEKIDADLGVHKLAIEGSPVPLENQHLAHASFLAPLLVAPTWSTQSHPAEKIFDTSAAQLNAGPAVDLVHGAILSVPLPDSLAPTQSLPSAPAGVSQADHSSPVPQSVTQAQASAAPAQTSSPATSTQASHALTTDLTSSNIDVQAISVVGSLLGSSVQKVITSSESGGQGQQITGDQSIATTNANDHSNPAPSSPAPSSPAPSNPAPSAFDAQADSILQGFMVSNHNFEEDLVGQHVTLVDKNSADVANSHFGSMSWSFADGSILTITGIIPSAVQAGVHAHG